MNMLEATSRTFLIPISYLPPELQRAVSSAYLCMRAIDEIEDHPWLPAEDKINLLRFIGHFFHASLQEHEIKDVFYPYRSLLPDITLQLADWITLCPDPVAPLVHRAVADMANGMADWVLRGWGIKDKKDLDDYAFCVAGSVGVLLSDMWEWSNQIKTDRELAAAFGRGLQVVNMIRNRDEDLARGIDFFPSGWGQAEMQAYARQNLECAHTYLRDIVPGPIHTFCQIPLVLAYGTLDAVTRGEGKLSRSSVESMVRRVVTE